ncbi:MAG: hypothetical protein EBT24_12085 [Betaproteobacteria bacterium]|nr:hypothetical protein [Betaproteobacteria bacterium]
MQIKRKQTREVSGTAVLDIEFDDGSRLEMLASLHIRLSHRASPSEPADTPLAEKMAFPIGLPDQPASG